MKKKKIYAWSSELSDFRGEGILALNFIYLLSKKFNKKILCESNDGKKVIFYKNRIINDFKNDKINLNFKEKYISPFIGIFKIWKHHLKGYKTTYVNFLPLWNIFIYLLLPKNTILGPITGANVSQNNYSIQNIIRKLFFPLLFRISVLIMFNKWKNFIFSTDILKENIPKEKLRKVVFNFQLLRLNEKKNSFKKKKIDFLIYYRKHSNKFENTTLNFIKKLSCKFSVYVVGDLLECERVKNLGVISSKKINYYLSVSRMTVSSDENLITNFNLDCINNDVKILVGPKLNIPSILKKNKILQSFQKRDGL